MSKKIEKSKQNQQAKVRNWTAVDANFRNSAGPMRAKQDRRKKMKNSQQYIMDHWDEE